jgi:teichuronic acid biosynthesis glycosyltransferase TuaH
MAKSVSEQQTGDGQILPKILILGTADWDSPIATNQHYVARELARAASVTFVESLGLRRPTLRANDVTRMAARLGRVVNRKAAAAPTRPGRPVPDRTSVVSPLVVPVHRAPTRLLNRNLLHRATKGWLTSSRPRVLWAFTPVTYGLEAAADVTVYHCVDLLHTVHGVDPTAVLHGERRLVPFASVAIATSGAVAGHLRDTGFRRIVELPNVADIELFARHAKPAAQRRPAVLFSGNLTAAKLDCALLEAVANAVRGHGELVLAGPVAADFGPALERLTRLGARYAGMLGLDALAELAGQCAVGLIPYAINAYTTGVSPLKCFEYLSAGLPILSTPLPEVARLAGTNPQVIVADREQLPGRLAQLLSDPSRLLADPVIGDRIASAAPHSWSGRGKVLRELLAQELAGVGSAHRS